MNLCTGVHTKRLQTFFQPMRIPEQISHLEYVANAIWCPPDLLPPLHRKRRIESINAAKRAISRKIVADICFTENNDLLTFWENKRFSTLTLLTIITASPKLLIVAEIQAYQGDPKELRIILSHHI